MKWTSVDHRRRRCRLLLLLLKIAELHHLLLLLLLMIEVVAKVGRLLVQRLIVRLIARQLATHSGRTQRSSSTLDHRVTVEATVVVAIELAHQQRFSIMIAASISIVVVVDDVHVGRRIGVQREVIRAAVGSVAAV